MAVLRLRAAALGAFAGVLLTVVVGLTVLFLWKRDRTPEMTQGALDAAMAKWSKSAVKNYDLDVEIDGLRKGAVHLEVRNGEVTAMTRDGFTPKDRRLWDVWAIEGQFDMIQEELDKENDATQFGAPAGSTIIRKGEFDSAFGYPIVYHRQVLGGGPEVAWRNVRFQPVAPASAEAQASEK